MLPRSANFIFTILLSALIVAGCDARHEPSTDQAPRATVSASTKTAGDSDRSEPQPHRITIASLVPAASQLILAMGAGDQLVATSNYDADPDITSLPRVGDYQTADWERIQQLRPDIMVIFQEPSRVSPGWKQRAQALNIELINVRTETLTDIYSETLRLGQLLDQEPKAQTLVADMRRRIDVLRRQFDHQTPVPTLVFMGASAGAVVGRGNFINEVLQLAGGVNVVQTQGWPEIDREQIRALAPQAIFILLSGVPQHVQQQALDQVLAMKELPAVVNGRVYVINQWYTHLSGSCIVDLAEQMAQALHPRRAATDTAPVHQPGSQP
ncbi:MAG: ABC transporter substrate-binding protein [Phycisphaerales bacterium]|nr:ABC transporter substrate-binding protein [Phycisphaerales bacterium]